MLLGPMVLAVRTFRLGRLSVAIGSGAGDTGPDRLRCVWFDPTGPVGPALQGVCACARVCGPCSVCACECVCAPCSVHACECVCAPRSVRACVCALPGAEHTCGTVLELGGGFAPEDGLGVVLFVTPVLDLDSFSPSRRWQGELEGG